MRDDVIRSILRGTKQRLRVAAFANGVIAASASAGALFALGASFTTTVIGGAAALALTVWVASRHWTDAAVARQIESADPCLQNLLITAQEALAGRTIHPVIARELFSQAADRLASVDLARARRAVTARTAIAVAALMAIGLLISRAPRLGSASMVESAKPSAAAAPEAAAGTLRVTIIPPRYARRGALTLQNPLQIEPLEGSTVRVQIVGVTAPAEIIEAGHPAQTFMTTADGLRHEFVATASRVLLIRHSGMERLLQVQVKRDDRPVVTIEQPGRDLLFGAPTGSVRVIIKARDDLNVAAVALRYTRIAGSGETFTFEEGELPLQMSPTGAAAHKEALGTIVLDHLKLEDGDTLVYRALAKDDKPGADPVASDSFLIEIGKRAEASSTGFALPEERDRQGLSQQMLIMRTERLHADRPKLTADQLLERSRLLAVEQRMVRAEFLFMTGGEVVDEVEEAEHAHELATGRFENEGQVELLNAIREMSRAEARLNVGDTAQALVFERSALRALERAFDRRRYFLRTLPERARIDPTRRLSGDLSSARPSATPRREPPVDPVVQQLRDTIAIVHAAAQSRHGLDAALAAQIVSFDPHSSALQQLAATLASRAPVDEKVNAASEAQVQLAGLLRQRLGAAPAAQLRRDPLIGYLANEVRR